MSGKLEAVEVEVLALSGPCDQSLPLASDGRLLLG